MIDVINLKKNFGDVEVLKGIDITINKGDIVAIIGPSGSGKSTFLRCLNCMEDPTSGQIIFNGVDIADMKVDINIHRRHMGMVFQHFNLFNNKTVIENIMLAPVYTRCQDLKKAKRKKLFGKGGADASLASLTKEQIKKEEKEKAKKDMQEICFGIKDGNRVIGRTISDVTVFETKLPLFGISRPPGHRTVIFTASIASQSRSQRKHTPDFVS